MKILKQNPDNKQKAAKSLWRQLGLEKECAAHLMEEKTAFSDCWSFSKWSRDYLTWYESTSGLDFNSTQEVAQLAQERVICFASHGPEFYIVATDLILMINQQVKCNLQLILRREKRSLLSLDEF